MSTSAFKTITFSLYLLLSVPAFSGDIDKAFKYLNTGDYPNALKFLREVVVDEPENAAANYGMAKYFYSKDNPAFNLDSANNYIKRAAAKLPMDPEDKTTKKYTALGVRDFTIQNMLKDINSDAYGVAEKSNSVESYQHFIDAYTETGLVSRATNSRNQLAYIRAMAKNTPEAISEFMKKYPAAEQMKEAKELYEKLLYQQVTADKTYQSYRKKYIDSYPNGAYIKEAKENYNLLLVNFYNEKHDLQAYLEFEREYKDHPFYASVQDSIYSLATHAGTVESFKKFIQDYPQNPNVKRAWEELYILYTADAQEITYSKFLDEYPNFPDKDRLYSDLSLATKDLRPFQQGEKWGYVYQPTRDSLVMLIPGEYEEAFDFKNGLAAVRVKPCIGNKCTYFYINKGDKRAFAGEFNFAGDFSHGYAIVGMGSCEEEDSCRYGIIDKRGHFVIAPMYDLLEDETDGLFMAAQNGKYGFLNARGETVVSLKYTDALPYSQGVAAVALDNNWFFIDREGRQLFVFRFADVSSFSDSLCAVTPDGENWGYIDMAGNYVIEAKYESAEDFLDGFGIISKKEKDPKAKGLMISQRYKINKAGKIIEKLTAPKPTIAAKRRK